ncbi:hypothetical protein VNO78_22500 [Psophocarpus tetragonolobus]|uniref:Uncharacterized protein n=1 Tax=Psophocarpus tetragonolobus TaxID=3891 RepID=A0AAN9S2X9_PSOTE
MRRRWCWTDFGRPARKLSFEAGWNGPHDSGWVPASDGLYGFVIRRDLKAQALSILLCVSLYPLFVAPGFFEFCSSEKYK